MACCEAIPGNTTLRLHSHSNDDAVIGQPLCNSIGAAHV